jgi:ketosteroid isomerase-like protein
VAINGIVRGWQAVLDRYRHTYPGRTAMGRLTFSDLEINELSPDAAYILGRWQLDREKDRPGGVFTLIARKFPEGWRIVHDHTSAFAAPAEVEKK